MKLTGFDNTRARIQRVSDSRFYAGWTVAVKTQQVALRIEDLDSIEPGETFILELYGANRSVILQAVFMTFNTDGTCTFQTTSQPFFLPGPVDPRFRVPNFESRITYHGRKTVGRVTDVSSKGLALEAGFLANRLEPIELEVELPSGVVQLRGHVRYCKPIPNSPAFRMGIRIEQMDRVGVARWQHYFQAMTGAEDVA